MAKWKGKSKEDVAAQLERLDKMMGSKMVGWAALPAGSLLIALSLLLALALTCLA